jgi:protease-4
MKFIKYTLASLLALVIFWFIGFIFLMIIAASAGSSGDSEQKLTKDYILELKLNSPLKEQGKENPFADFDLPMFSDQFPVGLNTVLAAIENAKTDDHIKAINLNLSGIPSGIATVKEVRDALVDFKTSGKKVYARAEVLSQKAFYLASVADYISLHPEGGMEVKGLSAQLLFFKDFLKKLGVTPQIIRHGKFKSAVEPFMLDKMSEANRLQTKTFIDEIWESLAKEMANGRGISIDQINKMASEFSIKNPKDALDNKLVDQLEYHDEYIDFVKTELEIEKYRPLKLNKYAKTFSNSYKKNRVAVLYAEGEIVSGKGQDGQMGDKTIVEAIKKIRKNDKIKATVLRINSPGGSALASDVMWRELILLKEKMPLIISMGDVAASGGYYIACMGDKIYAQENTITGSIGVFGLMFHVEDLVKNKLDLHVDQYKTHPYADLGNMMRPLTSEEAGIIQNSVKDVYGTFTSKVAEGRKISIDSVDAIGQGRVWTGTHALNIGLVDELGGIDEAIAEAASMAELSEFSISEYPKQKDPLETFFGSTKQLMVKSLGLEELSILGKTVNSLQNMKGKDKIQARIPYSLEIY